MAEPSTELLKLPQLVRFDAIFTDQPIPTLPLPHTGLRQCSIQLAMNNCTPAQFFDLVGLLPTNLISLELDIIGDRGHDPDDRLYWTTKTITRLPRTLRVFKLFRFPMDIDNLRLLPHQLRRCTVGGEPVWINNDISLQVISPHFEELKMNLRKHPHSEEKMTGMFPQLIWPRLNSLTRFESLTRLDLTISDTDALSTKFDAFPASLHIINILMNHTSNTIDYFSNLVFPPSLNTLHIKGVSNILDMISWHPLPDSLQVFTTKVLRILSLPLQWPANLSYLCITSYGNSGDDHQQVVARVEAPLRSINNHQDSLKLLPPRCITEIELYDVDQYSNWSLLARVNPSTDAVDLVEVDE